MLLDAGKRPSKSVIQRALDPVQQRRGTQRLAGNNQRALERAEIQLLAQGHDLAGAKLDVLKPGETEFSLGRLHRLLSFSDVAPAGQGFRSTKDCAGDDAQGATAGAVVSSAGGLMRAQFGAIFDDCAGLAGEVASLAPREKLPFPPYQLAGGEPRPFPRRGQDRR